MFFKKKKSLADELERRISDMVPIEDRTIVEEKIIDNFTADFMDFPPPSFLKKWFYYKPSHLWERTRQKIRDTKQRLTTGFPHYEAYGFTDWFAQVALPRLKFLRDRTRSFPDLDDKGKRYGEAPADDEGLVKWKKELDKIIWSLEHYDDDIRPIPPENYNPQCRRTKFSDGSTQYAPIDDRPHDFTPCEEHRKKVQDGLDLFAKHFYDLWL